MTEQTSGLSDGNFDLADIVEEAMARCSSELRSGWDFKSARRSLQLLLAAWSNLGINLWTLESGTIPLVTGQITYSLPVDTVDLLDHVIRTGTGQNQQDITITRISSSTYAALPNKNAQGKPIQIWINRQSGANYPTTGVAYPTINIWPTASPPDGQYTLIYWRLRRLQNPGDASNVQDIPFRFLPALISGLAYYIAPKIQGMDPQRMMFLKADYDEQLKNAMNEDREKASLHLTPQIFGGRSGC